MGPEDLRFRTKGQPAIDLFKDAYAEGLSFDFACGDEVYGSANSVVRRCQVSDTSTRA